MRKLSDDYCYKTSRLIIRFYNKKDFPKWQKLFSDMKSKQNKWDWEKEDKSSLTKERFYKKLNKHTQERDIGDIYYFCVENKDSELVGISLIKIFTNSNTIYAEIGFQLNNKYWNKGLGTELAQGLIDLCKNDIGIPKVKALVNKENRISINLLKSLGMKKVNRNKNQWVLEL